MEERRDRRQAVVKEIRVYFEGSSKLRAGFAAFFDRAGCHHKVKTIATDGSPVRDYRIGCRTNPDSWNILLKDSEGPDNGRLSDELAESEAFEARSLFWMVEMMESWFIGDPDCLAKYYQQDFNRKSLGPTTNVEKVPKKDVLNRLKRATEKTQKGHYHKTRHAPDLLATIDPLLIEAVAPNCKRLLDALRVVPGVE